MAIAQARHLIAARPHQAIMTGAKWVNGELWGNDRARLLGRNVFLLRATFVLDSNEGEEELQ